MFVFSSSSSSHHYGKSYYGHGKRGGGLDSVTPFFKADIILAIPNVVSEIQNPVGNYLSEASKISLEQCPFGHCSDVILLTLERELPTG